MMKRTCVSDAGGSRRARGSWSLALAALLLASGCNCDKPNPVLTCEPECTAGFDCIQGHCVLACQEGLSECAGVCRDLTTDRQNCGGCGVACQPGFICSASACVLSCPEDQSVCAGTCRSLSDDRQNCGGCGVVCAPGSVCSAGTCAPTCGSGSTDCDGGCHDLRADELHCGACGHACSSTERCENSQCVSTCRGGLTSCASGCKDTQVDGTNCGMCGRTCAAGEVCSQGTCATSCGTGFSVCAGSCRDVLTDRAHCGMCGRVCAAGSVCSAGQCQASCGPGQVDCGGSCIDPVSSPVHCGATAGCGLDGGTAGTACGTGVACLGGSCQNACSAPPLSPELRLRLSDTANPRAVLADVNLDGQLDVVAIDLLTDELLVANGDGDGGLSAPLRYPLGAGSGPLALAVGQLNADHQPDVVVAEWQASRVTIRYGVDGGFFPGPGEPLNFSSPVSVSVGDMNGDGLDDLAVAGSPGPTLYLVRRMSNGVFAAAQLPMPAANGTAFVTAFGDLNHDGRAELAALSPYSGTLSLFVGTDAGLSAPVNYTVPPNSRGLAFGDVDSDTDLDLVVSTAGSHTLLPFLGDGSTSLTGAPPVSFGQQLGTVALSDVTGDGRLDAVVADILKLWVLPGVSSPSLFGPAVGTLLPGSVLTFATGRLDGDGRSDAVVGLLGGSLGVLRGNSDASFSVPAGFGAHRGPSISAALRRGTDPKPVIVVSNVYSAELMMVLGDGDGGLRVGGDIDAGFVPSQLQAIDLNRDGLDDLLAVDSSWARVEVFLALADGGFARSPPLSEPQGIGSMAGADLNGDLVPDVVVATNPLRLHLGQGDGTFLAPQSLDAGTRAYLVLPFDVNADGVLDVVASDCETNTQLQVHLGQGSGAFAPPITAPVVQCPILMRHGEVSGDGHPDLVVVDGSGLLSVYLGDGQGQFTWRGALQSLVTPGGLVLDDFDGDGLLDVATADTGSSGEGKLLVFWGLGGGNFSGAVTFAAGAGPSGLLSIDLNGDGLKDLVVSDLAGNQLIAVMRNHCGP